MLNVLGLRGVLRVASFLLILSPFALSGCPAQQSAPPPDADAATAEAEAHPDAAESSEESVAEESDASASEPEVAASVPTPAETEEPPADDPKPTKAEPTEDNSTESEPTAAAESTEPVSTEVVLGDESLYDGIPGEGPLTVEEIKEWLEIPGVHEPLSISLPLGLSLGEQQITGLEENPMTLAKIELGRQLYFDRRLSTDFTISCASCHDPAQGWAAQTQFGVGVEGQTGGRNSPVSFNRILSAAQFWDGRAESLEAQAIGPIANPVEMGNTHEACVECLKSIDGYQVQFDRIFGPDSLNIDNVGKAIATFERAIVTGPSPYDYYAALKPFLDQFPSEEDLESLKEDAPEVYAQYQAAKEKSDAHPMSESAIRGMELFFDKKTGCTQCHVGANFTDEKYHNIGVGMDAEEPDLGRFVVTGDEKDKGAFKTPTVRNAEFTSPYMHDGSQKTLEEVVEWYAKGGHPNPWLSEKIKKLELTDQDKADLVAFMKSLSGEFPTVEQARLPE